VATKKVFGFLCAFGAATIWGSIFNVKAYLLLFMTPIQINFCNVFITAMIYWLLNVCAKASMKVDSKLEIKLQGLNLQALC